MLIIFRSFLVALALCLSVSTLPAESQFQLPSSEVDSYWFFTGYDDYWTAFEPSRIYDLSDQHLPELPDMAIGYINGIDTTFESAKNGALYISILAGGCNIHGVYNATRGIMMDLQECKTSLDYIASDPVNLLHVMWNDFFERSSSNATFLIICHSQGAIHVRNALLIYSPEFRARIHVIAIAPGGYIHPESCGKVVHYRVTYMRDPIPYFDQTGSERAKDIIIELQSHPNAPFLDHYLMSPTYQDELTRRICNYIRSNGLNI